MKLIDADASLVIFQDYIEKMAEKEPKKAEAYWDIIVKLPYLFETAPRPRPKKVEPEEDVKRAEERREVKWKRDFRKQWKEMQQIWKEALE